MKLTELRIAKGLQGKELAAAVGTDAPMISRFEHYKCLPIPKMCVRIADVLDCEIDAIYEPHEIYYRKPRKQGQAVELTSYRLTAKLPREARDFLHSGALQECGYKDITEWVNKCYHALMRTYNEIKNKEDQSNG